MPIVLKSGSLNLLEPSGPVQACNGIALPLQFECVCDVYTFRWQIERCRRVVITVGRDSAELVRVFERSRGTGHLEKHLGTLCLCNLQVTTLAWAGIAHRYSDSLCASLSGFESWWKRDIPYQFGTSLGLTQSPIQWVTGLFPDGKTAGAWG